MNRLKGLLVWIRRIGHCRGFGIQSPADYWLVRYVINEHWPYYAYERLGQGGHWLRTKIGRLCLRLANERQPDVIIDKVGLGEYLSAGCAKAKIVGQPAGQIELAVVPMDHDAVSLLELCNEQSVVLFHDIYRQKALWQTIEHDERVVVTYDLYYCGIALFDTRQSRKRYKVNF